MKLQYRIALRYAFSKRDMHFITVISTVSVIGITVGVAALIVVLSIFNGFKELTEKQIVGFDPHFRIFPKSGAYFQGADSLSTKLAKIEGVESATPILQGNAVLIYKETMAPIKFMAIPESSLGVYAKELKKQIVIGEPRIDDNKVYFGVILADKLRSLPKARLTVLSPAMIENSLATYNMSSGLEAEVSGLFQTNVKDYDLAYAFSNYEFGRKLFGLSDSSFSTIDVRILSSGNPDKARDLINAILPANLNLKDWKDLNKDLFQVMRFERLTAFSIVGLVVLIAAFNVMASLAMTVTEKRRDIGVLKAMGASSRLIQNIFAYEGLIIGGTGAVLGALIGVGACLGQTNFKWFKIDTSKYIIDAIPVSLSYTDVTIVAGFALIISLIAAIYPAKNAAAVNVISAVKEE